MSGVLIRNHHRLAFRPGQWALITGVSWFTPPGLASRPVFDIRFPDGIEDCWAIGDDWHEYEFKESA